MTVCNISLATKDEDQILKECIKNNEMNGSISIAFETEPSFFDALDIQGRESQVILVKFNEDLAGFGIRTIRSMYVNGKISDVGYLSGLRGNPRFRRNLFLSKGYNYLRELDKDGRVPFYLTTIIEDNKIARRILEGRRAGLPDYIPIDTLTTFVIKPQKQKVRKKHEIIKGNKLPLEDIIKFMHEEGKEKQFYPYYDNSDFNSERLRDLEQEDFYVAMNENKIVGIVAKWDQESFKQTRVVSYDNKTKIARPFINLFSRFSNIPNLPKKGELLHFFYAAFPTIKDNDPEILEELLVKIASDPQNKNYDYFALGLTKEDNLREAVKIFSPREYKSIVYLVSFNKSREKLKFLDGKIPYLEISTL